LHEDSIQVR